MEGAAHTAKALKAAIQKAAMLLSFFTKCLAASNAASMQLHPRVNP
jgi:hypothetical protein